ncbi:MAG: HAD family hydrolase [Candidatus Staskawiczbacteria bacterium]|nr:HAD family hydrolase [Candidatus Staskawiczbacteria bacterium]
MIKNVIFDWSGVVKDALECHLWLVNRIFKKFGAKEISLEELKENWEQPHMGFYNKYLPNLTAEAEEEVYKEGILSEKCPKSKDYPGICEFIKKLKEKGFFLGIISSDLPDTILPEIKNYGLENIFDEVVFLSVDKEISLKNMIEKFKLNPVQTYFIGDSNHEIIAGKATGVKTIAVTWGFNTEEYLKLKNPDYLTHNIKELEDILLG